MICPACLALYGCPVCVALYAGLESPIHRPAIVDAAGPDQADEPLPAGEPADDG